MLLAVLASPFASILASQPAAAARKTAELSATDQARAFAYKEALKACLNRLPPISAESAKQFDLKVSTKKIIGVINGGSDGVAPCGGSEGADWLSKAATFWGYNNGIDLLCDIGFTRQARNDCRTGGDSNNDFIAPRNTSEAVNTWWGNLGNRTTNEDAIRESGGLYALYRESFMGSCQVEASEAGGEYRVREFNGTNSREQWYKPVSSARGPGHKVNVTENIVKTCGELAEFIDEEVDAAVQGYQASLQQAAQNGRTPQYDSESPAAGEDPEEDTNDCKIDWLGWILCPVMNFIGGVTDASYEVIEKLMQTPASMFDQSQSTGRATYDAWSTMTNIANVAFIIAVLIIIFSHLTSFGVSNYGVKKLLPRLLIAAVLVNISFYLCAIAVEISNILGASLKGVLDGITNTISDQSNSGILNGKNMWANLVGAVLAGTIVGVTVQVAFTALLPILVAALIAVFVVLVVLVLRQALIILLIVIAPLAFVALLLPNTEGWFSKWRKLLLVLLFMYPAIAVIFGMAAMAGKIVMFSSDNILVQIAGAGITIIPLFITPVFMQVAGGVLNRFAGIVNDRNKGMFDRMYKGADRIHQDSKHRRDRNAADGGGGLYGIFARRRMKRDAISQSLGSEATRSGADYIAQHTADNAGFQGKLAGESFLNPYIADDNTRGRMASDAFRRIAQIKEEGYGAAKTTVEHLRLSAEDALKLAIDGKFTVINEKGEEQTLLAPQGSDLRIGALRSAVERGGYDVYKGAWDLAAAGKLSAEENYQLARTAASAKARPVWASQGALNQLEGGKAAPSTQAAMAAVEAGRFSPQVMANVADTDELKDVFRTAVSQGNQELLSALKNKATKALNDPDLQLTIAKNETILKEIAGMPSSTGTNNINSNLAANNTNGQASSSGFITNLSDKDINKYGRSGRK